MIYLKTRKDKFLEIKAHMVTLCETTENSVRIVDELAIMCDDDFNEYHERYLKQIKFVGKGDWYKQVQSGFDGFRCNECGTWCYGYSKNSLRCDCDKN